MTAMRNQARICLTILAVLLMSGSMTFGAARITSIELCTDVTEDGYTAVNVRETFDLDTRIIHSVVLLEDVRVNLVLRGAWVSVDAITIPNYEIGAYDVTFDKGGPASAHISLSRPTNGWPVGNYRLDIYLDQQLVASKPFSILGPVADETPAVREGQIYSHPAGFSFWYPAAWTITNQNGVLQLTPPEAATSPQGPLELFFLATESIAGQGIQEPTDETVVAYLNEQVKSLSPVLEYTGRPVLMQTDAGKGAVLVWQATAPDGRRIIARVFVTFARETAVILIGMGLQERIDARDTDLQDLFKSITAGQVRAPSSAPARVQTPAAAPVPSPTPAPTGPSLDQQLKALEAAKEAGVLSEQEYAAKRRDLEQRRGPTASPETARKLEALRAAHQAGLFTDDEYAAKKAQLLAEPPPSAAQAGGPGSGEASPAHISGKTYRHALGFSFWYPGDWTVKELQDALQLIPPNPGTTANGESTETYFIVGDTVTGTAISRADDPRVVQYMDQAIGSIAYFLRRTAAPVPKAMTNGQGTVMNWEGKSPTGNLVGARAYVSIIKGYGVALVGLCFKEQLERRDAVLQRIFASFAFEAGQVDRQLCGTWTFLSTQALTNTSQNETAWSRARMASDARGTLSLQSDGTWTRSKRTHMIAGAGGVWLESDDTEVRKGRWNAGNGSLYLIGDDSSWEDYKYQVRQTPAGLRLLLSSGEKGELWEKAN